MANRFCGNCGARLLGGASFCVECGERQPGAKAGRPRLSIPLQRYAPLFVVLAVVAVGGGAVLYGLMSPKVGPAAAPGRDAPPEAGDTANLPAGHPPIAIPEQVKQTIREMAQKAAAAPDDLEAWKQLADVQYRAGQLEPSYLTEAKASFQHVLQHEPNNLDAIRNLGNIAFDQNQHDAAVKYYQQYLKLKPDDLNVQTDLGTMYLAAGQTQQAITAYDAVLKTDPSFFQAQFNLAIAYRTTGETDKFIAALEKARTLTTDDKTRTQVDQLLARAKGEPAPPAEAAAPPAGAPAPAAGTFQADAEAIFRDNPIMGPKVQRVEWPEPESAKVYLHDFPMDQMPEAMRTMFLDRMKDRIKEQKDKHQVTQTARFDLVDVASGKVMGTITE